MLLILLVFVLAACSSPPPAQQPATQDVAATSAASSSTAVVPDEDELSQVPQLDGVAITLLTMDGPQIAEPLKRRAPEFEQRTGASVTIKTVPFADLYQEIANDLQQATPQYDAMIFAPQWMVDYAAPGYLEDLTSYVEADAAIQWADIAPFFRDFSAVYNGNIYTIPLDGDFQMVYYRTDILGSEGLEPPTTWDDYLAIALQLHGQDMNGDGEPDYGSCICNKPNDQAYHMVWSVASPYIQTQGTQQGAFFDTETMQPLVQNEAFAKTLDIFKASASYGPEGQQSLVDIRTMFIEGRCALTLDWGDIGTLAIDPAKSQVIDNVGAVILPGTTRVLDRATGKLVDCDKTTCPYAIEGVNHAPYAAFGGWSGAINAAADPTKKAAAYAFLSYMSQPAQSNSDVTIGITGFNPYRTSQFTDRAAWLTAGMSDEAASKYLGAIGVSLSSPNVVLDLRIPQNQQYQEVVLDETLSEFLVGNITQAEAMQRIAAGWEAITNELGRDVQRNAYRATLGLSNEEP